MTKRLRLTDTQMERIATALAEPRRFRILRAVAAHDNPPICGAIAEAEGVSPATISHHLKELQTAELIEIVREGKFGRVSLRRDIWDAYLAQLAAI